MARPRKDINFDDVDKLCGLQCTEEEIAQFLGVSVDTLARACKRRYRISFAEYFGQKRGLGRISLRRAQWQAAQKGNPTLLIWLGKQYLGQKDKSQYEHTGANGGPMEFKDTSSMTPDQIEQEIQAELAKRGKSP
jgi:AraC-like DNA-binding protein